MCHLFHFHIQSTQTSNSFLQLPLQHPAPVTPKHGRKPNKPDVFYSRRIPGISVSFQRSFLYYANWFSLLTLLLSIWCFVSNAIVIIGLLRSGIRSLRPGLLIVCTLAFSDLMWGATVAPIYTGFSEVSWQMYEMVETNFGNTSHDVFSNPPRDHLVLPNAAFKLDVICILTPRSPGIC